MIKNEQKDKIINYFNNIDFSKFYENKRFNLQKIGEDLIYNKYNNISELLYDFLNFIQKNKDKKYDYSCYSIQEFFSFYKKDNNVLHNDFKINFIFDYGKDHIATEDIITHDIKNANEFYFEIEQEMNDYFFYALMPFIIVSYIYLFTNEDFKEIENKLFNKVFEKINLISWCFGNVDYTFEEIKDLYINNKKIENDIIENYNKYCKNDKLEWNI